MLQKARMIDSSQVKPDTGTLYNETHKKMSIEKVRKYKLFQNGGPAEKLVFQCPVAAPDSGTRPGYVLLQHLSCVLRHSFACNREALRSFATLSKV